MRAKKPLEKYLIGNDVNALCKGYRALHNLYLKGNRKNEDYI